MKDTDFTDNIICPYCGEEDEESWELNFGDGIEGVVELTCEECGKKFMGQKSVTIMYSSWKIPEEKEEA